MFPTIKGQPVKILVAMALLVSTTACGAEEASELTLTANGLGGIGGSTEYSVEAVSAAMPGYVVTAEEYFAEGDAYPMLVIRKDDQLVAEILSRYGDDAHVGSILVRDPSITLEGRVAQGDAYQSIEPAPTDCVAGMEENSGMALCRDGKIGHIGLNFSGEWAGPDGALPPAEVLATFTVKEITWSAGVL
jgi:uncharacterized protein DUF1131